MTQHTVLQRAALLGAMVLAAGCAAGTTGAGRTPGANATPAAPAASPAGASERVAYTMFGERHESEVPRVVLLDAGESPRVPLRWQREAYEAVLELNLARTFEARSEPADGGVDTEHHQVSLVLRSLRQPLADGENLSVAFQVEQARVVAAATDDHPLAHVEELEGANVWLAMTPRGQVMGFATKEPVTPVMHQIHQALAEALGHPVPSEDVGVGARWRVRRLVDVAGFAGVEEVVYQLRSNDRGMAHVTATVHRLPLFDDAGMVAPGELDRARRALDALDAVALGDLDREVDPSARGELSAVFSVASPTFGFYERGTTLEGDWRPAGEAGAEPSPVQARETTRVQLVHHVLAERARSARAPTAP